MKNFKSIAIVVGLVIALFILLDGFYVVDETEQVIITQFGDPVGQAVTTPGMKFKTPFIQRAHFFDKRYLEWDGDRNQVPTKDKKFIFVDTYARWQITDPLQFLSDCVMNAALSLVLMIFWMAKPATPLPRMIWLKLFGQAIVIPSQVLPLPM